MKKNIIYHNPRCSKSRQTLAIVQEKGGNVEVVEYLKTPPTVKELQFICKQLKVKPIEIIRTKESLFKELGLSVQEPKSEKEWLEIIHQNPILLERPIVVYQQKVAIGRPPENILEIFP